MFWIALWIGLTLIFAVMSYSHYRPGYYNEGTWVFGVFAVIFTLVCLIGTAADYSLQRTDFTKIRSLEKKVQLYEAKRDNVSLIVRAELRKYPDLEKQVIGKINPSILLNFPKLQSNQTMTETLKQLLKLENEVYNFREKLIDVQQVIYAREISPWVVYVTPYQEFLGEENPVSVSGP